MSLKVFTPQIAALTKEVPDKYKEEVAHFITKIINHEAYENEYPWSTSDFEMGSVMGTGQFGRVYCAKEKQTGHIVAIKTIFKSEIVHSNVEVQVLREIEIQSRLKHPNILRLLTWFHDDRKIYLVLEFASGGELYRYLKNAPNKRFSEYESASFTKQIASALDYCHKHNIIHRDIKPENILVSKGGILKLADFGWSVHAPSQKRKTMCGTLDYLPPEMIGRMTYGVDVDKWCLGILCYEFLVGFPPFKSANSADTFNRIKTLDIHWPSVITPLAKDLLTKLLRLKSSERITLKGVMNHLWIEKFVPE